MRGVLLALSIAAVLATLVPIGCNSSSGTGAADSGVCVPVDATITASVASAGSGTCASCIRTQCMAQAQACADDCTCNDVSVSALACVEGLGGNASVAAATSCLVPLANSSDSTLLQFGQCLETQCAQPCGATPSDGGCSPVDASLSALLAAGSGACEGCLQSHCTAAAASCSGSCTCNAVAVAAVECLASLGGSATVASSSACAAPVIGSANLQLVAVGGCLLDSCPAACGVPSDAGPVDASSGSSGGGSSGSGSGITGAGDSGSIGVDASGISAAATGIAVDASGYVFVAHSNGISVFNSLTTASPLQLLAQVSQAMPGDAGVALLTPNGAGGIAVDSAGHLLVANYYETSGSNGCYFQPPSSYGSDVASYTDHSTSSTPPSLTFNSILVGNPMNATLDAGTALDCASGVATAPDGSAVFVVLIDGLRVFDGSGNLLASAPYPSFTNPNGIAFDPTSRYVYVTDANNGVVDQYLFTPPGGASATLTLTNTITVQGDADALEPLNVAVDSQGNVYVSVLVSPNIYVYSSTGTAMGPLTLQAPNSGACGGLLAFDSADRLYLACGSESVGVYAKQSGSSWQLVGETP
jgi:hypothetical protein